MIRRFQDYDDTQAAYCQGSCNHDDLMLIQSNLCQIKFPNDRSESDCEMKLCMPISEEK